MTTVQGWDCTHSNISHVPSGQGAGYTTGTADIAWTPADWAAHPHAVRIDQDSRAGDGTADCLDVESGAATPAECPGWVNRARASWSAATRPGQRHPAIYVNRSNVTAVANALTSAGLTGVGLWVADWNLTSTEAASEVATAAGPFPVVAVQYSDQGGRGAYDLDVFSAAWLDTVSGKTPPAKGPYRHVVPQGNDKSFWRIAQDRHVDENWLLGFQKGTGINAQHLAVLTAMVAADDACAAAKLPRPALTAGVVYYTEHP